MNWIYLKDNSQPPENEDFWVSCKLRRGARNVCIAYFEDGVWRFSDDMIANWKDEELLDMGWEPYAYMPYNVPEPAKLKE